MRRFEKEKKIALIAHDNKKKDLIEWATYNKSFSKTQASCHRNHR